MVLLFIIKFFHYKTIIFNIVIICFLKKFINGFILPIAMDLIEKYTLMFRKHHNKLLIIPILLLLLSIGFLVYQGLNGEVIKRGVSLKGGISLTISNYPPNLEQELKQRFKDADFAFRTITIKNEKQLVVEATDIDIETLQEFLREKGVNIVQTEIVGATLGEDFFKQSIKALLFAFLLMSIVVLIYFRTIIPSFAVVLSAASDIIEVIAIISLLGIRLDTAGIAALLMLIGYSVDTDILLTTRIMKKTTEKKLQSKLASAMRTGLTMSITTFGAVFISFLLTNSNAIRQIMLIVMIGLIVDLFNTWIQNAAIITSYAKKKKLIE